MPTLTYRGDLTDSLHAGNVLGCDSEGWPWQVVQVETARIKVDPDEWVTLTRLEPWPIPRSGPTEEEQRERRRYGAARAYADRVQQVHPWPPRW